MRARMARWLARSPPSRVAAGRAPRLAGEIAPLQGGHAIRHRNEATGLVLDILATVVFIVAALGAGIAECRHLDLEGLWVVVGHRRADLSLCASLAASNGPHDG